MRISMKTIHERPPREFNIRGEVAPVFLFLVGDSYLLAKLVRIESRLLLRPQPKNKAPPPHLKSR